MVIMGRSNIVLSFLNLRGLEAFDRMCSDESRA
jgi:hypothetical protein